MSKEPAYRAADGMGVPVSRSKGLLSFLRDIVVVILIALVVSFLVKTFLVRSFFIPSGSMEDTLAVDDRILVDELTPRFTGYDRGDVVVFRDPGGWLPQISPPSRSPLADGFDRFLTVIGLSAADSDEHLVKRIIGLPGDHVECCNSLGQITVNGSPIDESAYIKLPSDSAPASALEFDVVVPDNALWVLGDNRNRSQDSRYHQEEPGAGFVPLENVVGRSFIITWPFERWSTIDSHPEVFNSVRDATTNDDGE
ncbi:signal peptidase I [Microbacterium sp. YY-01]|uniref:signal peptidase I n=1 Tax=Microbacterium sp. YY-01 TaxID=3421634 RepID=UPI003D182BC6